MTACRAVLNVKGEHFTCEMEAPHPGLAHANRKAEAIWCSDGEARKHAPSGNRTPTTPQKEVEQ